MAVLRVSRFLSTYQLSSTTKTLYFLVQMASRRHQRRPILLLIYMYVCINFYFNSKTRYMTLGRILYPRVQIYTVLSSTVHGGKRSWQNIMTIGEKSRNIGKYNKYFTWMVVFVEIFTIFTLRARSLCTLWKGK